MAENMERKDKGRQIDKPKIRLGCRYVLCRLLIVLNKY